MRQGRPHVGPDDLETDSVDRPGATGVLHEQERVEGPIEESNVAMDLGAAVAVEHRGRE
jgi:hypothetical protein